MTFPECKDVTVVWQTSFTVNSKLSDNTAYTQFAICCIFIYIRDSTGNRT